MSWDEASYIIKKTVSGLTNEEQTGIPPLNMVSTSLRLIDDSTVRVSFQVPSDTFIDDQCICTLAGVRIVRKEGTPPLNPWDGVLVKEILVGSEETEFLDSDVDVGKTYYYHFYPYSDHGVYNLDETNSKSILVDKNASRIFGFHQDFSDLNPDTTIRYLQDCENADYEPMMTNEANGESTAGSWGSFLTEVLKNFPFMVKKTGEADYMLDPNDYTKKASDQSPSDYNNTSYEGGAFAWINKLYMKEEYSEDGNSRDVRFSDKQLDGYYPVGFMNQQKEEVDGVWIPMGYTDSNGRVLIAGTTPYHTGAIASRTTLINNFSDISVFFAGPILNFLRDLEYLLFRSTDIQLKAGYGCCNYATGYTGNGPANKIVSNGNVQGWYGNADKKTLNKKFHSQVLGSYVFSLPDPYLIINETQNKLFRYDPFYNIDVSGNSYNVSASSGAISTTNYAYPNRLELLSKEFGSIPKFESAASSATGLCDAIRYNANSLPIYATRLGAMAEDLADGPGYLEMAFSQSSNNTQRVGLGTMLLPPIEYSPKIDI